MILWLYRFIKGFLLVEFSGERTEEILNLAAKSRIKLWGLKYIKRKITGYISINDFIRLRSVIFGSKIKVHILNKQGVPFIFKKYNNRIGFYIGAVIFFIILKIMSGFIWIINVEGNGNVNSEKVLSTCKKIGIYEGILSNKIDTKNDAIKLALNNKQIAWASLNIEGSVLNVNISQTKGDNDNRSYPSNIKAGYDGVIKKINVTSGDVVVKTGDIVKKGDLLVSGIIENANSTVFTDSSGEITALTKREFTAKGKKTENIMIKTGEVKKHSVIKFFNIHIPLYIGEIKEPYSKKYTKKDIYLFEKRLPVSLLSKECKILKEQTKHYTNDELTSKLFEKINKESREYNILEELENNIEETESKIIVRKVFLCEENIAVNEPILFDSIN